MKILPILFAFLVSMNFAYAEKEIFSGKLLTDTDKEINGRLFRFSYDETSKRAFAQNPSTNLIVNLGECKQNTFFKICVNNANISHKNFTTYVNYYEIDVDIYELDFGFAINSTYPPEVLQGEQFDIKIIFRNPTSVEAKDFLFSASITNFSVIEVKGCSYDDVAISLKGNFGPGYYRECSIKLSPLYEGKFALESDLSYTMGFSKVIQKKGLASIEVLQNQLDIKINTDSNTQFAKPFYFNVSARNRHPSNDMDVTAYMSFPRGLTFLKETYSYDKSKGSMKDFFPLAPGSAKNYSFLLKSDSELNSPFSVEFTFSIDGIEDTAANTTFINVTEPRPEIQMLHLPNATPSDEFVVQARLYNPSPAFAFEKIKATLHSEKNEPIIETLDSLNANDSYSIISHTILIPKDATGTYDLSLDIEYYLNSAKKKISRKSVIILPNSTSSKETSYSKIQGNEELGPDASLGNDPQSQVEKKAQSAISPDDDLSTLEGLAMIFGSFATMNHFQKIMLIFGAMILVSTISVFVILRRLKIRQNAKLKEVEEGIKSGKLL